MKLKSRTLMATLMLSATALMPLSVCAQDAQAIKDTATPKSPVVLPMTEPSFQGEVGRTFKDSDHRSFHSQSVRRRVRQTL